MRHRLVQLLVILSVALVGASGLDADNHSYYEGHDTDMLGVQTDGHLPPIPVPDPPTLVLLAAGTWLAAGARRRFRRG